MGDGHLPTVTMEDLLLRHKMPDIDFVKMDIEGSEFALFESADWLKGVKALSMETHPLHGDPGAVLETLKRHDFSYAVANDDLDRVSDPAHANFIYAWKAG